METGSKTVAFHTLGCKLNFAETSTIGRLFTEQGYKKVDFKSEADVYVLNTCSVTENADKECRMIVRQVMNTNPDGYIVITGCYAQLKPQEIANISGVDLVLGANEKFNILNYIQQTEKNKQGKVISCDIDEVTTFNSSFSHGDRTRVFLKVQDGCDYNCAFCTIPLARGSSRSDSIENIVRNARKIAAMNVKEVVLTGVNIGDFGKQLDENSNSKFRRKENFNDLVKALDEVEGIDRIRISSIEPNLLKNEIIEFVAHSKRFVPHFHIPLQSGSNTILKSMLRRYTTELYTERISVIKQLMPDACVGVDVIVGFPGETETEFQKTYDFLNQLDISYLHVFTYSERDNTLAIELSGIVPVEERKRRNKMLRILSAKKQRQFYENNLGKVRPALFESENKNGFMFGFTDNYVKIKLPYQPELMNQIKYVKLNSFDSEGNVLVELDHNSEQNLPVQTANHELRTHN